MFSLLEKCFLSHQSLWFNVRHPGPSPCSSTTYQMTQGQTTKAPKLNFFKGMSLGQVTSICGRAVYLLKPCKFEVCLLQKIQYTIGHLFNGS
jgi:hypothetical protein